MIFLCFARKSADSACFRMRYDMNEETSSYGINGAALKWIAVITMIIDHIGASTLHYYMIHHGDYTRTTWLIYRTCRGIGRIAFPIFIFLLVEGYTHTKSLSRYLMRLGIFCLVSEIPFDLAFYNRPFYTGNQNIFLTLLIGLAAITGIRKIRDAEGRKPLEYPRQKKQILRKVFAFFLESIIIAIAFFLAHVLHADYDIPGVAAILVAYRFRNLREGSMIAACLTLLFSSTSEIFGLFSLIPIYFYNGTRGRQAKYFFYAFYPVHLLILWGINRLFVGG